MNSFWFGIVESRMDPLYLGRCQVRILGVHTEDISLLPTNDLPWAVPIQPISSSSTGGLGTTPIGPVEGTMVVGFFLDHPDTQTPAFFGAITGIPQEPTFQEDYDTVLPDTDVLRVDGEKSYLEPNFITPIDLPPLTAERLGMTTPTNFPPLKGTAGGGGSSGGGGYAANSPHQIQVDTAGFDFIKENEPFYEVATEKDGKWLLGYGETEIDGTAVSAGMTITQDDASKSLYKKIRDKVEPYLREKIKIDVTQSMFNSLASLVIKNKVI